MHAHHNNHCKKPCPKPCEPKCGKIVKYDSWSESSESCEEPTGKVRTVVLKEYIYKEQKKNCHDHGYKTRQEGEWEPIKCEKPKKDCHKPKQCDKKKHH